MLVLTRKLDEKIMIGDGIEVTIVEVRSDRVRLGIRADASIPVHRQEVHEAIQRSRTSVSITQAEDQTTSVLAE